MIWIRDPFDMYDSSDDLVMSAAGYGNWDGAHPLYGVQWGLVSSPTPFNSGQSLRTSAFFAGWIYKNAPSNQVHALCAFRTKCDSGPFLIHFDDGAGTAQVTIYFDGVSDIIISNANGTLGTWEKAYKQGQWNHFQIRVQIDPTIGTVRFRKNGKTVKDDFEVCGNTQVTANTWTNCIRLQSGENSAWSYLKDFVAWDMTGPGPWNNWVGDMRSYSAMPLRDESVQFAQHFPSGESIGFGFSGNSTTFTLPANELFLSPVTPPPIGGQLDDLTITMHAGFTGNLQAALYAAGGKFDGISGNGDAPGALLAQTDVLVNPVTGANTLTWSGTRPSVGTGQKYWLALWADAAFSPRFQSGAVGHFTLPLAYSGSPPDPFTAEDSAYSVFGGPSFGFPPTLSTTLTITNAACVDELSEDGLTTYVGDSVIDDEDLYGIGPLPGGMDSFLGADLVMLASKSAAGDRGIQAILKSGASQVTETEENPNTGLNYYRYQQDTDPATGLPWDLAALNALLIGQKVSS